MRAMRPQPGFVASLTLLIVLFSSHCTIAAPSGENELVRLGAFDQIYLSKDPLSAERSMAEMLQKHLQDLYGVNLAITSEPPEENQHAIVLGRRAVSMAGTISEAELEAVKYDGYLIKASPDRISVAGYAPQGTIYATHAFLRRLGLKTYPWRNFGAVEIRQPLEGGEFAAFTVSSKPFFSRRDLLGYLDQGRWGASLLEYGLGEFRLASCVIKF